MLLVGVVEGFVDCDVVEVVFVVVLICCLVVLDIVCGGKCMMIVVLGMLGC